MEILDLISCGLAQMAQGLFLGRTSDMGALLLELFDLCFRDALIITNWVLAISK